MAGTRKNAAVPIALLAALCAVLAGFLVLDRAFKLDRQQDVSLAQAHLWLRPLALAVESGAGGAKSVAVLAGAARRADPRIGGLQVLTGTNFLYHSDPRKLGADVDPQDAEDKGLYDDGVEIRFLLKSVRRKPYLLDLDHEAGTLALSEPALKGRRKSMGTLRIGYGLEKVRGALDLRIAALFLALLLAFYFLQKKLFRWRWPFAAACLLLALAAGSLLLLGNEQRNLQQAREAKLAQMARVGVLLSREAPELLPVFAADLKGGLFSDMLGEWKTARLIPAGQRDGSAVGATEVAERVVLGSGGAIVLEADAAARAGRRQQSVRQLKVVLAVFGLLAGLLLFFIMAGHALRTLRALNKYRYSYIMVFPAMVGMIALVLLPFLYGLSMAFFRVPPSQGGKWVFIGLQNFVNILSDFHPLTPENFYFILLVTLMWTVINVFLHVSIGLTLAVILNKPGFPLKRVYRVLLILPWAMPSYITALIWKGMFHKQFGAINAFIKLLGFEPISFFNNFWTAFFANVATNTWLGFPFMMVICLGALQSIPADLYEAAQIDGAGRWQQFKSITVPLLKPALFPAIILGTIWTFNMFNVIYLVSNGEPNRSTEILITQAYRFAFEKFNWGYAAAYSILIFLILLAYGIYTNRITRATEGVFD
jgi:arabinogalactan oligomer/maltooligosaccharide transport system permease protein